MEFRNKWLPGAIVQRLGPTSYPVNVEEHVHIDHLLPRIAAVTQATTLEDSSLAESLPVSTDSTAIPQDGNTSPGRTTEVLPQEDTPLASQPLSSDSTDKPQEEQSSTSGRRYPVRVN